MRIVIAVEAEVDDDTRTIEPGALHWEEGKAYPLTLWNVGGSVIGRATDIRREADGRITAEIEMSHELTGEVVRDLDTGDVGALVERERKILEGFSPSIYATDLVGERVVREGEKDLLKIIGAELRGVFLAPEPGFPYSISDPE